MNRVVWRMPDYQYARRLLSLTHKRTRVAGLNCVSVVRMKICDTSGDKCRHRSATEGITIEWRVAAL